MSSIERDAAGRLLAPVSLDAFLEHHFEQRPLHVPRNDAQYFADVYSVAEVEDSLLLGAQEPEQFALLKAGTNDAGSHEYTLQRPAVRWRQTGRPPRLCLDPRQVAALFERGYTLFIKDGALFSARLQRFCNALQQAFDGYAQANVYFSPPNAQGLDIHHDTHDTIVAQIAGAKRWRIYEPIVELPLESQPLPLDTPAGAFRVQGDVTLRPGDSLYIPRGYPHLAIAGPERSLHVTFALVPNRVIDLVHAVVRQAAEADVALRRSLPRGWYAADGAIDAVARTLAAQLPAAFAAERVRAASRSVIEQRFASARGDAHGTFGHIEALAALKPSSTLHLCKNVPHVVREGATTISLWTAGRLFDFPASCGPAFARLAAGPVTVAELDPALSDADRTELIATLVLQGLLAIDEPS